MRKIFITIVLLFSLIQTQAQLTSVHQLKDIKKDNPYYDNLKNLVEIYAVIGTEETRQGNNYYPDKPLTHRSFAIAMVNALDKLHEKLNKLAKKKDDHQKDSLWHIFAKKYMKGYADSAVKDVTYAQYKDVNNDDVDKDWIKKLTNEYNLKLGDTYNTFSPESPMTEAQLSKIFVEYFNMRSVVRPSSAKTSRGKWASYLDILLERLNDVITDLGTSD
ncbi:MAG TPA: hypothetical protein VKH37_11410 [Ferruginibacter sp.]|nr:hypothetical protein [Ferruginibacter sp.]